MGYEFQPKSGGIKNILSSTKLYALIAVVIIVFSFSMFLSIQTITGLSTYGDNAATKTENMKNELNASIAAAQICSQNLERKAEQLGSCSNKFVSGQQKIASCESEKISVVEQKNIINSQLVSCQGNASEFESLSKSFKSVIKDSVKNICCTPGNEIINWDVRDDKIVCVGNKTLDCATGETTG